MVEKKPNDNDGKMMASLKQLRISIHYVKAAQSSNIFDDIE